MSRVAVRPNLGRVLASLKDFQRDTVEYVYRRLYTDADSVRRFLVADEVGLGKTLVAKGVIAKAVDTLWDRTDRIDIIYVCSNADIARQNINRLNITGRKDVSVASRITLLPTQLHSLKTNRINFISFTPSTSFDLAGGLGRDKERALMYWLLDHAWGRAPKGAINLLRGAVGKPRFRDMVREFENTESIDRDLADSFARLLGRRELRPSADMQLDLRAEFNELCEVFRLAHVGDQPEWRLRQRRLVGELRERLAETCMQALQPDVIVLDEFQRFKHLLDDESDASELARGLFDYSDATSHARVLLLSATPYRMYTITDEPGGEDHYADFLQTYEFLSGDEEATAEFRHLLGEYRQALLTIGDSPNSTLGKLAGQVRSKLQKVMVRTERLGVSEDRNGMLTTVAADAIHLNAADISRYLTVQRIARRLDREETVEYWKSAPYLLNFMESYLLKRDFAKAIEDPLLVTELITLLKGDGGSLLNWETIRAYSSVDPANARLRWVMSQVIDNGAWKLLWVPPACPYYELGGPFAAARDFTKRLVFSSWHVVPKAISALLSYEAERLTSKLLDPQTENTEEARRKRRGLLRFSESEGRLTGMPLLALMYPSIALAEAGDPFRNRSAQAGSLPKLEELLSDLRGRISAMLAELHSAVEQSGPEDESWYWAAPLLLDLNRNREAAEGWLAGEGLAAAWAGESDERELEIGEDSEQSAWLSHLNQFRNLVRGEFLLGRVPQDLPTVLALVAVAAPGVATLRALARVTGGESSLQRPDVRLEAARIGWAFRSLFNSPEVMSLVRASNPAEPYWRRVLSYCAEGCLGSVMDEYAHVLQESRGLTLHHVSAVIDGVGEEMRETLTLRTSTMRVDDIRVASNGQRIKREPHRMRTRFAMRFGSEEADEGEERMRADSVRKAFNSPFWPFVLTTTSVGQEGLDFHQYCHAVVHWNLPASPVDFEQREGRVHRYKGHAVRKNVALAHSTAAFEVGGGDPWAAMFAAAANSRPAGINDLVPYWIYSTPGGSCIERHVPILPLSREVERFAALKRASAAYRMVFGQARQDDLLGFLLKRVDAAKLPELCRMLQIDLSPPRGTWTAPSVSPDEPLHELSWEEEKKTPVSSEEFVQLKGERLRRARNDSDYVRRLAVHCLPDEMLRRAVLERMAETIRLAHEQHPGSWSISLWGQFGDPLRVNVGPAEAVVLLQDGWLGLMTDRATLGKAARDALRTAGAEVEPAQLRSLSGVTWIEVPSSQIMEWLPKLRDAHEKYVRRATRWVRRVTRYARFHAPATVVYFNSEGLTLPSPEYLQASEAVGPPDLQ